MDLVKGAEDTLAIVDGKSQDVDLFYSKIWEKEREVNALSREDVELILTEIIRPRVASFQNRSEFYTDAQKRQGLVGFAFNVGDSNYEFMVVTSKLGNDYRISLTELIVHCWSVDYRKTSGKGGDEGSLLAGVLEGLKRDGDVLKKAGFVNFVEPDVIRGEFDIRPVSDLLAQN